MINLREMTKILSLVVYIKLTNVVIASDRLESTQWWQSALKPCVEGKVHARSSL